jgi:hypothetical protein
VNVTSDTGASNVTVWLRPVAFGSIWNWRAFYVNDPLSAALIVRLVLRRVVPTAATVATDGRSAVRAALLGSAVIRHGSRHGRFRGGAPTIPEEGADRPGVHEVARSVLCSRMTPSSPRLG